MLQRAWPAPIPHVHARHVLMVHFLLGQADQTKEKTTMIVPLAANTPQTTSFRNHLAQRVSRIQEVKAGAATG
jgi:hypothetical protein